MSLQSSTSIVSLERRVRVPLPSGLPDKAQVWAGQLQVLGTRATKIAIGNGAPNTEPVSIKMLEEMREQLLPTFEYGPVKKIVLLVCFGRFMPEQRIEQWAAKNGYHKPIDVRTLLAHGEAEATFCRMVGSKRIGIVSLAKKVRHLGQSYVCTLYYEDKDDKIKRALVFEPYSGGFAAHHVFGFEIPQVIPHVLPIAK